MLAKRHISLLKFLSQRSAPLCSTGIASRKRVCLSCNTTSLGAFLFSSGVSSACAPSCVCLSESDACLAVQQKSMEITDRDLKSPILAPWSKRQMGQYMLLDNVWRRQLRQWQLKRFARLPSPHSLHASRKSRKGESAVTLSSPMVRPPGLHLGLQCQRVQPSQKLASPGIRIRPEQVGHPEVIEFISESHLFAPHHAFATKSDQRGLVQLRNLTVRPAHTCNAC